MTTKSKNILTALVLTAFVVAVYVFAVMRAIAE
jgi:multisubunit Na+/H+ antiporter MnhC subunit